MIDSAGAAEGAAIYSTLGGAVQLRRSLVVALSLAMLGGLLLPGAPAGGQEPGSGCHPFTTPAEFGEGVPTSEDVLGFELGEREVTVEESNEYLRAVARASDRVVADRLGESWQRRAMDYAIVGSEDNVTPDALRRIRKAARALRKPGISDARVQRLVDRAPLILWIAANQHGGEESGADASLRTLYELATRTDCAARRIRRNAITVILPIMNPDGRTFGLRRNSYGFDLNRDWFARTQVETDAKLSLIRRYPPVMFIDAHEMGSDDFFMPPNADPAYHEISSQSINWINNIYGEAMGNEFDRQGIPYWTREVYDLFALNYGDTVPTTAFGAAGMTLEKDNGDPIDERAYEQYVAQWASLFAGVSNRRQINAGLHDAYVDAYQDGVRGKLEPNQMINPENEIQYQVPNRRVRHYFLFEDADKTLELQMLIRRLQRMGVKVFRLTESVEAERFRPYGRGPRAKTIGAGTYWIPMAQAQKRWVQGMLNEDTYAPFPYFYDVTGWSQPLLFNLSGGYTGEDLFLSGERVSRQSQPEWPRIPADAPLVAVYQMSPYSSAVESNGWLRFLLEREWDMSYWTLTSQDIIDEWLPEGVDVLVIPNGDAVQAEEDLGPEGIAQLQQWVNSGGRLITWRGGTELAAALGLTTATLEYPTSDVPGTLFRVNVGGYPLNRGVGRHAWAFYEYDNVMTASDPSHVVASFPGVDSPDWFVSGFAEGEEELGGTAAIIREPVGEGEVIASTTDLNFRAWTVGTQRLLWNAVFGPDLTGGAPRLGAPGRAAAETEAAQAAADLPDIVSPLRIAVPRTDAAVTEDIVSRHARRYEIVRSDGIVRFLLDTRERVGDQIPFASELAVALQRAGVEVRAYKVP